MDVTSRKLLTRLATSAVTIQPMLLTFVDLILIFLSVGISLGIVVPLTGVLVRFRANFNPKALQLDAEGGAVPHTGPVINSYFSMMMRVWKHEVRRSF